MKRIINWGLISTARINRAIIPAIRESKRSRLVAVGSRTLERAREYATEWNIPEYFGSYEALLDNPEIDAIYNPLPNHMHTEWVVKAAEAGKHVLCEKPIALTPKEVTEMEQAAAKANVHVVEAFMYRHHPQTIKIQQIIKDGQIGNIKLIRGTFTITLGRPGNFRWDPNFGGGSIWDVGCYPISYMRMLVGCAPDSVFGWQTSTEGGVDETFMGQLHYPNGIMAHFDSSFSLSRHSHMEILGTNGMLVIPSPFKPNPKQKPILVTSSGEKKISFRNTNLYLGEVEDLENAILNDKPVRISLSESRDNIQTITSLLQSASTNSSVSLESNS